jgi:predicted MFS family arabinose efflux permease
VLPVVIAFVVIGVFLGSWTVITPELAEGLGGGEARLGMVLSVALLLAAVVNVWGGALAERRGTAAAMRTTCAAFAAALVGGALLRSPWGVAIGIVVVIAASGAVDVVVNVAATAGLADRPGRLVRVHAGFNAGGALGAVAVAALLAALGAGGWRPAWLGIAVMALALGWWCGRSDLPAGHAGEHVGLSEGVRVLREDGLVPLAGAFALGALVEGGIATWGVLRLRNGLDAGLLVGAGGAVAGYALSGVTRLAVSGVQTAAGARRLVVGGALLAAVGIGLLAAVTQPVAAAGGLVLAAAGISVTWPLIMSEVGRDRERPGAVVGALTSAGYLGIVVGPGALGLVAGVWSLPAALWLLAVASAGVAVLVVVSRRRSRAGRPRTAAPPARRGPAPSGTVPSPRR